MLKSGLESGECFTKEKFGSRRGKEEQSQTNVCEYLEFTSGNLWETSVKDQESISIICEKPHLLNLQNQLSSAFNLEKHIVERLSC